MKWIHLTHDFFACVDDEDYPEVSKHIWSKQASNHIAASSLNHIYLHHFLIGKVENMQVDHINRAPWDNRRCNLRVVSQQENLKNKGFPIHPPHPNQKEMDDARAYKLQKMRNISKEMNIKKWMKGCYDANRKAVIDDLGNIYSSCAEAERYHGKMRGSQISKCCKGKIPMVHGRKWSFYKES